ncbi:MAG: glycosyltransferase family 2 protein, partial [Novosphingobium sp.]
MLALDRPAEAEALLDEGGGRERRLLRAASHSAQGRHRLARRAINGLFESDGLEAPLAVDDAPLTLEAFHVKSERSVAGPRISVIVAAKDAQATIGMALGSLQAQSLSPIEILVVDDASSDETVAIVSDLAAADPRIRLVRNDRAAGAYGARNAGMRAASGDVMTFHDADDWAHPRRLEVQAEALKTAAASVGSYFRLTPQGRI